MQDSSIITLKAIELLVQSSPCLMYQSLFAAKESENLIGIVVLNWLEKDNSI